MPHSFKVHQFKEKLFGEGETMVIEKEDNPTPAQRAVIDQVAAWIDANVIAYVIAEELVDNQTPVTLKNCQKVWLRVLDDLHQEVRSAIPRDI